VITKLLTSLKRQQKITRRYCYSGIQKISLLCVQQNCTHSRRHCQNLKKRNTIVIGASCDTAEVHFAWLNTAKDNGGIEGVTYPIVADSNRNLASILDILDVSAVEYNEEYNVDIVTGDSVSYRATYLIDEEGTVFHEGINHMPLGRNVNEFIRLIDAYSHVQKNGEVCPANWEEGKDAMKADRKGTAEYLSKN